MKHSDALTLLARETRKARRALALERGAWAFWPVLAAIGVWAAFALAGGHELLPPLAQSLSAIAALAFIGWLGWRAWRSWRMPTEAEARARLAADSALDPGAFEALEDRPSKLDPLSVALWRTEQRRAIERAEQARARPARPALDEADPWKLRFVLAAGLVVAAIVAGPLAGDRLTRAFLPDPGPLLGDGPIQVEAWLTPASYTGASPVSLSERLGQRVESPPSVEATVRVTGPTGAPRLVFEGGGERRVVRFTRAADNSYEARIQIPRAGVLKVVRFHTRARWRIQPGADNAPRVAFAAPITLRPEERATLAWRASDDYGVSALALRVTPVNPPPGLRGADPIDTPIEGPAGDPREAEDEAEIQLADHPYAGLEVEARLVARDALGQEGVSEPMRISLPEKVFLQPLAQAAVEIRRMILWERRSYARLRVAPGGPAWMAAGDILTGAEKLIVQTDDQDPRMERAPEGVRRAARYLDALTIHPDDGYFADLAVFTGFRLARAQLAAAREIEETNNAAEILWRTALRAEYGGAADARRALEMAQRALADAIENGASQERVAQHTEALRRAKQDYLRALVEEARRAGEPPQTQEDTLDRTELSQRDLQEVLDEIERLNQEGRTQEAAALLEQLNQILQNLDVQMQQQSAQGGEGQQGEEGERSELEQSMQELSEAMGEQRQLNEQTQREQQGQQSQSQQGQEGQSQQGQGGEGENGEGGQGLAGRQGEIREQLNRARGQAGRAGAEGGEELQSAEQAMRRAEEALRRGAYEDARAAQDEALQSLREGAASLAAEMAQRENERNRAEGDDGAGERDPLGRVRGGVGESGETQVPAEMERARSREILDELRRRAQDPRRPEAERDYLRRLLDRFTGS
ncbi:MAG: DUF4175 domain-containing protein [Hyphomonadaceae bacterium]